MVNALVRELFERRAELKAERIATIYFGGGTPSVLRRDELAQILTTIRSAFEVDTQAEVTLEANPEDISPESLNDWKILGVNRLSIGLQSFRDSDLAWMNRAHSVEEARCAVRLAQDAGFLNLTVDLIYGLPGLSLDEWKNHVQTVLDMDVPHVSAYCLTVERKTALYHRVQKGELQLPDDEAQAAQFLLLIQMLEDVGLAQYEISNFARPGWESKHNSSYWRGSPYLGVGPSAHSFDGAMRRWNVAHNRQYMDGVENAVVYFEQEVLSNADRFNESLLTGLRTREGVEIGTLDAEMAGREEFKRTLNQFQAAGWLTENEGWIRLTGEGKLRADYIASELFSIG